MPSLKLRQDIVKTVPYEGRGGKHQCVYWDAALEAFGLRVYPTGRRVYVCTYRVLGRKRLATLGRADVLTLDQARRTATTYLGKVAAYQDPKAESDERRTLKTIEELCAAYIEQYAKPKKISWKGDESCLDRRVIPKLKTRLAVSITTPDIESIHAEIGIRYPYAANDFLTIVRKMFNWARIAGYVPKNHFNPTAGVTRFRERKRRRFITVAEMPRFIRALEQEDQDYARHALWLLLLTGLRSNELLKAKWENVDWDGCTLFIGLTKNGDPLLAPLSDAAIERLRAVPRISGNPYIICGAKRGRHLTGVGEALRRVLKRARIENVRVHDLRRTVGSWLAQDGISLHLIGDVLNHRDPKTTAGYAYFQTHHRRQALTTHGSKVLTLGGLHLSPPAVTALASSDVLVSSPDAMHRESLEKEPSRRRHYFKREALYDLVWTAPVLEVSRRLGVSDVALAKLCRRAEIPLPPRGYWPRVESGRQVGKTLLPPSPAGLPDLLRIRGSASLEFG